MGRHANYPITHHAAERWVNHMLAAMVKHDALQSDEEALDALKLYFRYTSHYIVSAMVYMRDDQLSGGTGIDPGRVW